MADLLNLRYDDDEAPYRLRFDGSPKREGESYSGAIACGPTSHFPDRGTPFQNIEKIEFLGLSNGQSNFLALDLRHLAGAVVAVNVDILFVNGACTFSNFSFFYQVTHSRSENIFIGGSTLSYLSAAGETRTPTLDARSSVRRGGRKFR